MATKKFLLEVEEGESNCIECPFHLISDCIKVARMFIPKGATCWHLNLATMKITEYEDNTRDTSVTNKD